MLVIWKYAHNEVVNLYDIQTLVTFCLSVFSATLGIVKFLKVGPCRLLSYNKIDLGFFLLTLNIATCIIWKGFNLVNVIDLSDWDDHVFGIMLWMSVSMLPQMAFVSSGFFSCIKFTRTNWFAVRNGQKKSKPRNWFGE